MKKLLLTLCIFAFFASMNLKAESKMIDPVLIHIYTERFETTYYYICPKDNWRMTNHTGEMNVRCAICGQRLYPVRI